MTQSRGKTMNTKNLKPFNLQAALQGEPVMLRNGNKAFVRHHETEEVLADSWELWGIVILESDDENTLAWWTKEGRFDRDQEYNLDIIGMYQKTHTINGFEVPAPETEWPEFGSVYFIPDISSEEFYNEDKWNTYSSYSNCDKLNLERGLVFLNKEDAIANAKAMLGINPYEDEE